MAHGGQELSFGDRRGLRGYALTLQFLLVQFVLVDVLQQAEGADRLAEVVRFRFRNHACPARSAVQKRNAKFHVEWRPGIKVLAPYRPVRAQCRADAENAPKSRRYDRKVSRPTP